MNGQMLVFALFLGLATALPTKNLKTLSSHRNNTSFNGNRLGIYDGSSTTIAKHNYLVGILGNDEFTCAGVIISEKYVLTIAVYIYDFHASKLKVVAGSSDGTTGTSYSVKELIVHPNYTVMIDSSNFALLEIKGTFAWGEDIGNVTLPSANPQSETKLVVAGYGDTKAVGSVSEGALMQGTMKYVTAADCESYYSDYEITWDDTMACAYNAGKVTMCDGDYGNPFTKGRVLYGLFADGGNVDIFCTSDAIPVIISNVYTVVDWINEYI